MISRALRILWWSSLCIFILFASLELAGIGMTCDPCSESYFTLSLSDSAIEKRIPLRFCDTNNIPIIVNVHAWNQSDAGFRLKCDTGFSYNGIFELTLDDPAGAVRWVRRYDADTLAATFQGSTPSFPVKFTDHATLFAKPWERSAFSAKVIRPDTGTRKLEASIVISGGHWLFGDLVRFEDEVERAVRIAILLLILIPAGHFIFRNRAGENAARQAESSREKLPFITLATKSIASPFYWALGLIPCGIVLVALVGALLSGGGHGSNAYAALGAVFAAAVIVPQFLLLGLGCTMYCRPFHLSRRSAFLAGLRVFGFSLVIAGAVSMVFAGAGGPPVLAVSPIFWAAAFLLGKRE